MTRDTPLPMSASRPGAFTISRDELVRRRHAFDRLGIATIAATALGTTDLVLGRMPALAAGVLALLVLFLASRVALARLFDRFAQTRWVVAGSTLTRTDAKSELACDLASVRALGVKRTTAGTIREMKIALDDGRTLYPNAIDPGGMEAFRALLLAGGSPDLRETEIREVIDFDAPWFYVVLGVLCGAAIALLEQIVLVPPGPDPRVVYAAFGLYAAGLGVYWLRTSPLTGRFGDRSSAVDRVLGIAMLLMGIASVAVAVLG